MTANPHRQDEGARPCTARDPGHELSLETEAPHTRRALIQAAAAVVLMLIAGCGSGPPAPAVTYVLLDGQRLDSQTLQGRVQLINFWATSCAVCVREMPQMVAVHQRLAPKGLETVAVAMQHDAPANVVHFAGSRALPFRVAIDNTGALARAFGGITATPTTLVVDRRGVIVQRIVGEPDFASLDRLLESLLASG